MKEIPQIPLKDIAVGPNPRQHASKTGLQDLTASVKQSGVLEPILVRPNPNGNGKGKPFLLVCGERRYHASVAAGLKTIPAIARQMTDAEALETQIVENLQREDVHFLDEAQGFARLLAQGQSQEDVAVKVGKSLGYVASRLSLTRLIKPLHKYAYYDRLPVSVALRLSRLTPQIQKACLADFKDGHGEDDGVVFSMGAVDHWLQSHVYLRLAKAPFHPELAKAGSCLVCPKRTGANKLLFPDFPDQDVCTDPACFQAKCKALVQLKLEQHPEAVRIAAGYLHYNERQECDKREILREFDYDNKEHGYRLSKREECPDTHQAVVVAGDSEHLGKTPYVCTALHCKIRARTGRMPVPRKPGEIDPARARQVEELWQRRTSHACRLALHEALRKRQQDLIDLAAKEEASGNTTIPLAVLRFAVKTACVAIKPQQEGGLFLEKLWLPEKQKESSGYGGRAVLPLIEEADQNTLLRLLLDFCIAQDVAGKFSDGKEIEGVSKNYGLNVEAIKAPVEQEWGEKKRVSYAKRAARLAKEQAKAQKA